MDSLADNQLTDQISAQRSLIRLTPREYQFVEAVSQGLTNIEISERMGITARMVRQLLVNIRCRRFAKPRPSRYQLALMFQRGEFHCCDRRFGVKKVERLSSPKRSPVDWDKVFLEKFGGDPDYGTRPSQVLGLRHDSPLSDV